MVMCFRKRLSTRWFFMTIWLFLACVMAARSTHAATLVSYQFTGSDEATRRSATTIDPLVTTTSITFVGTGANTTNGPDTAWAFGTQSNASGAAASGNTLRILGINSTQPSPLPSQYLQFTITPQTAIDLTSLEFDFGVGGTGNRYIVAEYSFDDFTTPGISAGVAHINTNSSGGTGHNTAYFYHYSFALEDANPALQSTDTPITFRLYFATPSTGSDVRLDNITVIGSAVPEPSKALLLTLSLFWIALQRRRLFSSL